MVSVKGEEGKRMKGEETRRTVEKKKRFPTSPSPGLHRVSLNENK